MATNNTLIDQLPARQRAALEFFEGIGGYAFTHTRSCAGGLLVVVCHDDGTEVEIDDAGCCYPDDPQHFAATATDWPGDGA